MLKRSVLNLFTVLFTGMQFLAVLKLNAQIDPKAEELLGQVSKKYEAIKSYKANFVYQLENPSAKVNEKSSGEINVKGDKYTLKLGNQEIINNGTTIWTYMKEENEVNVSDYNPDDNDVDPTKIYSMYKQGFKYILTNEEKGKGVVFQIVDLIPENKKKQYHKIRLWINKKDKSISQWKIFEKNGNRYLFSINNFQANTKFDDTIFTFDKEKHKGVEVIDLR